LSLHKFQAAWTAFIGIIEHKRNLSASCLDKITYPIFKFLSEESSDLFINDTKMLLHTRKYPMNWKEEKVVMLPKPQFSYILSAAFKFKE
jgi:hypothetical protein